jgi:hypothetical protein
MRRRRQPTWSSTAPESQEFRYRLKGTVSRDFLLQAFPHLPPVSTTQVCVHHELQISPRIFGPNGILRGLGEGN